MKLKVVAALRLIRKDLDRLTDIHRQQFFMAVDPVKAKAGGDIEDVYEIIETGKKIREGEGEEVYGLIYVRLENIEKPLEAYEGWFIDARHYPDTESMPDGGAFFKAGTTELAGVGMSQAMYSLDKKSPHAEQLFEALKKMGSHFSVIMKGPQMKTNPPFAHKTAPKKVVTKKGPVKPIDLEVLEVRRYIQPETLKLPAQTKLQIERGTNWKFSTLTLEHIEKISLIGSTVYWNIDLGPNPEAIKLINGRPGSNENRSGLIYLKLKTKEKPERVFEGWFYDKKLYPSKETKIYWGCLLAAGTATPIGVSLEMGKVKANLKKGLPDAEAIAEGFKKLGIKFETKIHLTINA